MFHVQSSIELLYAINHFSFFIFHHLEKGRHFLGDSPPDLSPLGAAPGRAPGPCGGTSVLRTPSLSTPENILRASMFISQLLGQGQGHRSSVAYLFAGVPAFD